MGMPKLVDPAAWITNEIQNFVETSPENSLANEACDKAWGSPLIGFSQGDDPVYEELKTHVGPFHFTPLEIFSLTHPDVAVSATELTVISWILPQTEKTKADNRKETIHPAESWGRSRIFGEKFNVTLHKHIVALLQTAGYEAVAPTQSPHWSMVNSERFGFASKWSERHVAYVSGLGTFGLSEGLITPLGKAMRAGSVVARIKITPNIRPYHHHQTYCLFLTSGSCGKCIQRCPAAAITKNGHDKELCRKYVAGTAQYLKDNFGFEGYGCGLCQTKVPCESKIPAKP